MSAGKALLAVLATTLVVTAALFHAATTASATTSIDLEVRATQLATVCSDTQARVDRLVKCQRAKHRAVVLRKMVASEDRNAMRITKAVAKLNRAILKASDVDASAYDAILSLNARVLRLDSSALQLSARALPGYPTRLTTKINKVAREVRKLDTKVKSEAEASDTWAIIPVFPDLTPDNPVTPVEPTPSVEPTPEPVPTDATNVKDYGAKGDGKTDDVSAIRAAITAADGGVVYLPPGTYYLASALNVPDGSHLVGPSGAGPDSTAHLKGSVVYNSNSAFTDLKIGNTGNYGLKNGASASTTTFTRCQFRGGASPWTAPLVFGGGTNDAEHITFTDCNIERNLGNHEANGASGYNNVLWIERVDSLSGAHMEYITFTRCHFGVSNGRTDIARNIGAPRACIELWNNDGGGNAVRHGWHHVEFWDCIFEAADGFTINAPSAVYNGKHTDGHLVIDGCTIYGGGVTKDWHPYGIALEGPNYMTVNDCDIYPAYSFCLSIIRSAGVDSHDWEITNNRFHLDDFSHSGITARGTDPAIWLQGSDATFTGNTVDNSTGSYDLLWLGSYGTGLALDDCTITGNTFHELRSTAHSMVRVDTATNCTITGNTFETEATSGPTFSYTGRNSNNTITNNVFLHN